MHFYSIRILSRSAQAEHSVKQSEKECILTRIENNPPLLSAATARSEMAFLLRRPLLQSLRTVPRTIGPVPSASLAKPFLVSGSNSSLRLPSLSHAFSSLTLSTPPRRSPLAIAASAERGAGSILGGIRTIYLPKGARKPKGVLSRGRKKTARAQGKRKVRPLSSNSLPFSGDNSVVGQRNTTADCDCMRQAKRRRLRMNQIN